MLRLEVGFRSLDAARDSRLGASICVDGVCLTVAALDGATASPRMSPGETLRVTTLGAKRAGARVNLEPCAARRR